MSYYVTDQSMVPGTGMRDTSKPLVVVLEDDFANAWGLSLVLQDWGYSTMIGDSIAPVVEKLDRAGTTPDAAICDFHLARGESGVAAAAALRRRYGKDVPVVIVTGSSGTSARREARPHHFPVLSKPVDPDVLATYLPRS